MHKLVKGKTMTEILDVVNARSVVLEYLQNDLGLITRDHTLTEFSKDGPKITDQTVRFKVGTSHGEVSVSVYQGRKHARTLRVTRAAQLPGLLLQLMEFKRMQP